jgi:two-component system, sensor histidine kinase and response regulator
MSPDAEAETTPLRTLLICDDEDGPRQSLNVVFRDTYEILMAESGEEALELARGSRIDAAILDIRMAGMSGTELLGKLKELDPGIEVIMLTAHETMDTAKEALRFGACDYLTKPFEIGTVRASLENAMQRRSLSEAIANSREQMDSLHVELQDRSLKEELARTQNEIYESVMHDIGSPLTAISVLIQILNQDLDSTRGDSDPEKVRKQLRRVDQQVGRCIELSRRYLDYARQRASGDSEAQVNQCMKDVYELVSANPHARDNTLEIDALQVDVWASINGTDLIQILMNLVVNALQCTKDPHTVRLRSYHLDQPLQENETESGEGVAFIADEGFKNLAPLVAVIVEDNGPGMEPGTLKKIFQTYFSTKNPGEGTGLGLAIVQRLLRNANGALRVVSAPGQGASFTVFLPIRID